MPDSFYNTTGERGDALKSLNAKAKSQEDMILAFFRLRRAPMSPSYIEYHLFGYSVPLTSVRRAMTNLTKKRLLEKLEQKMMGRYGHREHFWSLVFTHKQADWIG